MQKFIDDEIFNRQLPEKFIATRQTDKSFEVHLQLGYFHKPNDTRFFASYTPKTHKFKHFSHWYGSTRIFATSLKEDMIDYLVELAIIMH